MFWGALYLCEKDYFGLFSQHFLRHNLRKLGVGRNFGRVLIDEVTNLPQCIFLWVVFLWKMKFSLLLHRCVSEKIVQAIAKTFVIDVAQNIPKCNFECYVPSWKIKLWGSSNISLTSEWQDLRNRNEIKSDSNYQDLYFQNEFQFAWKIFHGTLTFTKTLTRRISVAS